MANAWACVALWAGWACMAKLPAKAFKICTELPGTSAGVAVRSNGSSGQMTPPGESLEE